MLPFLEPYAGQSTDELIALAGRYRTDSLVLAFEWALLAKAERVGFTGLTREEQIIIAIEACEREVNNGGFDQLFVNIAPRITDALVESFERIGCPRTAALVREAVAANALLDAGRTVALASCDDRYYALDEDIAGVLFAFITEHRAAIDLGTKG